MLIACVYPRVLHTQHTHVAIHGKHTGLSMAYDKLHKMCKFHATRKCSPHKHVMGFIIASLSCVATCVHACKNEVIIEQYHISKPIKMAIDTVET